MSLNTPSSNVGLHTLPISPTDYDIPVKITGIMKSPLINGKPYIELYAKEAK